MSAEPQQASTQNNESVRARGLSIAELHSEILELRDSGTQDRRRFLEIILALSGASGAAFIQSRSDSSFDVGPLLLDATLKAQFSNPEQSFADAAAHCIRSRELYQSPVKSNAVAKLVALPMASESQAVVLVLPLNCESERIAMAQILASTFGEMGKPSDKTAVPSLLAIAGGATLPQVFSGLAEYVQTCTGADVVFVGYQKEANENYILQAGAGVPDFDYRSDIAREIAQTFPLAASTPVRWSQSQGQHAVDLRQIAANLDAQCVIVLSSQDETAGRRIGLLLAHSETVDAGDNAQLVSDLNQLTQALRFRQMPFRSEPLRILARLMQGKNLSLTGGLLALLVLLGFLPVPDRINADVLIEPAQQRMISTPFDTVLEQVNVRAGDQIEAGQTLLRLDGRELQLEREALELEAKQLGQREVSARARGELDQVMQTRLEIDKNAARAALVDRRLGQLEIVAPISGTVLSADLDKELGRSLQTGQTLMEIAPLTPLRVELQISVRDIARVPEGAEIELTLDAVPDSQLRTRLERIRPRAVSQQAGRYFVAEALIRNEAGTIRPGTNGKATIHGHQTRLAQRLFRRPIDALRRALQW